MGTIDTALLIVCLLVMASTSMNTGCLADMSELTHECVLGVDPKDIKQIGVLDALIVYSQGQGLFEKEMEFIIRGLELQPTNQTFLGMQVVVKWCTGGYWQGWRDSIDLLDRQGMLPEIAVFHARSLCLERIKQSLEEDNVISNPHENCVAAYLAEQPKLSRILMEPLIGNSSSFSPLHLLYLQTYYSQKLWKECGAYLKKLLKMAPNNFFLHYQEATLHLSNNSVSSALASVDKSIQLNPRFPRSHYLRMKLKENSGDLSSALESALEWQRTVDDSDWQTELGDVYFIIGGLYYKLRKFEEAQKYMLRSAIVPTKKNNSRQQNSYKSLVQLYYAMGNIYKQISSLAVIQSRWPAEKIGLLLSHSLTQNVGKISANVLIEALLEWNLTANAIADIADIYHQIGKYDEAIPFWDAAIQQNPQLSLAYIGKGTALCRIGKTDDAMNWFKFGIMLEEDTHTHGLTQRGKCLLLMEEYQQAKEDLSEASSRIQIQRRNEGLQQVSEL